MPMSMDMRFTPLTVRQFKKQFNTTNEVLLAYATYLEANAHQHHYGVESTNKLTWYFNQVNTYMKGL